MGENCSATSRLIVHEAVKDELMQHIIARTRDWKTGDPLDPAHHLGALVDKEHFKKVSAYLKKGKVIIGGKTEQGCYVLPTIIDGVKAGDKLAQEEIFGPVLAVITVRSTDEAIAVANQTDYGLAASLFSANGKQALRAAREIRAGTVTINCYGEGDITTPFGGYKQSGFGGRDNSLHAHDQYTELKTIWIDLSRSTSRRPGRLTAVIKVDSKPADLGRSGWDAILPAREPEPPLAQDIHCDYLVVGAGFAGLAAARRLRQIDADARIVIVEAQQVASGPAGRNSGFMIDLPHALASGSYAGDDSADKRNIRMNRAAIAFAGELARTHEFPRRRLRRAWQDQRGGQRRGQSTQCVLRASPRPTRRTFRSAGCQCHAGGLWY